MNCIQTLAFVISATLAQAADLTADSAQVQSQMQSQIDRLQKALEQVQIENEKNKLKSQQNEAQLTELKAQNGDKWLTQERAAQIRGIVQDVIADSESRASLQATGATSGYDHGFFIASPDGNFKLLVEGQLQVRYTVSRLSTASLNGYKASLGVERTASGFEVRRARIFFSGNVIDPSWTYRLAIIYNSIIGNANVRSEGNGANVANGSLEDAWINKNLGNEMNIKVGQFKSPFNREELVSSRFQLCVERSLVNQLFTTKFTQGIIFSARNDNLMGEISFNDGGNNANIGSFQGNKDSSPGFTQYAFTGRVQYMPYGNWRQYHSLTSEPGEIEGLLFGAAFNWQRGGVTNNTVPTNGNGDVSMFTWTADAQWLLGGANIFGSIYGNTASNAGSGATVGIPAGTSVGSSVFTYGATLQAGYFLTDTLEAYGRFEWYDTLNNGTNGQTYIDTVPVNNPFYAQHNSIYTLGLNWFIAGKQVKFTTDIGYAMNGVVFTNGFYGQSNTGADYRQDSGVGNGGQVVFRTQLQLLF